MRIKGPGLGGGGAPGTDGLSAYQIAIANGFVGTQLEWLESLNGADGINGDDGTNGASAYMLALVEGYVGTQAEWIASLTGADGTDGTDGIDGTDGVDGLSAYELALAGGFIGTEAAWLASLVGMPGNDGIDGIDGTDGTNGIDGDDGTNGASAYMVAVANGYVGTQPDWLLSLVGAPGTDGIDGTDGINGTNGTNGTDGDSAYEVAVNNGFVGSEAAWLASLQGADGVDAPALKYRVGFSIELPVPIASEVLFRHTFTSIVTFADDFAGSTARLRPGGGNPASTQVFNISINNTVVGTLTISTGGACTLVTTGTTIVTAIGDEMRIDGPAAPHANIIGVSVTLLGTE